MTNWTPGPRLRPGTPGTWRQRRLAVVLGVFSLLTCCSAPAGTESSRPTNPPTSCAPEPSACGYPDASNTGVPDRVDLIRVPQERRQGRGWHHDPRGWIEVDGDGAVLDGISIEGGLNVTGSGVTIRNSRIVVGGEAFGIGIRTARDLTIEDCEIRGVTARGPGRLLVAIKDIYSDSTGLRIRRNDISRASTGVQVESGLIEDNYIHDLGITGDDHVNGTTSNGGDVPLVIRHNTIFNEHRQTDAVSLFQDFGPQRHRLVDDNLMAGGGYTLYAGSYAGKTSTAGDIRVTNNRFSRLYFPRGGFFGPVTGFAWGGGNVWSGNVWDDATAAPVSP